MLRTLIYLGLSLMVLLLPEPSRASADTAPLKAKVWCHYVAWDDWNGANGAFFKYYDVPLAHPSGDPRRDYRSEMDAARLAGIDAFVVDLVNADAFTGQTLSMLASAKGSAFEIAVCLDGFADSATNYARKVASFLDKVGDHPNYARADGKPVLFMFWGWRQTPAFWKAFRQVLAEQFHHPIYLVGDPNTESGRKATPEALGRYAGCFDQFYSFAETGRGGQQPVAETYRVLARAATTGAISGQWTAGITPGYTGAWPLNGRNDYYVSFQGLDRFWTAWETALPLHPAWIHLTTWNDLDETPLQPMVFQFHTYQQLSRFWIDQWRGTVQPAPQPRIYCAYQREQIVGTLQRIEVLGLPAAADVVVSGELRDMDGKVLAPLAPITLPAARAERREWQVPTAAFARTPIVEPVIRIQAGTNQFSRRLPFFRLRTGWIANKVVIRVPADEMAAGTADVSLQQPDPQTMVATLTLHSPEPIRSATLWREDRPVAAFSTEALAITTASQSGTGILPVLHGRDAHATRVLARASPDPAPGTVYGLQWKWLQNHTETIALQGAQFLQVYQTGKSAEQLKWDAQTLQTQYQRYDYLGAKLLAQNEQASLSISIGGGEPQQVKLAALRQGAVELASPAHSAAVRLSLAPIDPLAATPPLCALKEGQLQVRFHLDACRPADVFYVRCETEGGRTFFSGAVAPFAEKLPLVRTTILQTAETLDSGFLTPPTLNTEVLPASVHPALLQRNAWRFDQPGRVIEDTLGRSPLLLGCAGEGYQSLPERVPAHRVRADGVGCLYFDGQDDIAEIPIRQVPIGAFTVSMEVCPEGPFDRPQNLLGRAGTMSCPLIRLLADGRVEAGRELKAPDVSILGRSAQPLPAHVWSKLKVTFDEQQVRLYVDGQLVGQASGAPCRRYGNCRQYLSGPDHPFHGQLANVLIQADVDTAH